MEPRDKELIFIDGNSTDGTTFFLENAQQEHQNVRLIHNPERYVPFALNQGIKAAKGDLIIRIDAHCDYAEDYFAKILETFELVDADIVGGPTRTAARSKFQEAVGYAISSPVGIGNSKVHDEKYRGYSDSVTFGAWRRELFNDTGLFDEDLMRNQDDEFHYRSRSLGKKIYQNPDIKLWYYPRNTLKGLFKQYFQYGLYKPLVLKKVRSEIKLRHLIPALFVIYCLLIVTLSFWLPWILFPMVVYLLVIVLDFFRASYKGKFFWQLFLIYPAIHIAYGSGFLFGIKKIL